MPWNVFAQLEALISVDSCLIGVSDARREAHKMARMLVTSPHKLRGYRPDAGQQSGMVGNGVAFPNGRVQSAAEPNWQHTNGLETFLISVRLFEQQDTSCK